MMPVLVGTHYRGFLPQDEDKNDIWSEPVPTNPAWPGAIHDTAAYRNQLIAKMSALQVGVADHLKEVPTFLVGTKIGGNLIWNWGDFDGDVALTTADLDLILRDVHARDIGVRGGYNWLLDVNVDGTIDDDDADQVIEGHFQTRRGDIDYDQDVDDDDGDILANNFGTGSTWSEGDLNGDGEVDLVDFNIFLDNYPWGN
jgi:hypothetical protein